MLRSTGLLVALLFTIAAVTTAACSGGSSGPAADESVGAAPSSTTPDPGDPNGLTPPDTGPGLEWRPVSHPGYSLGFVVWSGTQFVTINTRDDGTTELLTSADGRTWTDAGRTFDDIDVRDLAVSKDALAVWGTVIESAGSEPGSTIDRIHFSPDNGATWHQRDIRPPGLAEDAPNPGSSIVTAAVRGRTVLVSAFFRGTSFGGTSAADGDGNDTLDPGSGDQGEPETINHLLRLDLPLDDLPPDEESTGAGSDDGTSGGTNNGTNNGTTSSTDADRAAFAPVPLEPAGTFVGDITVTASGIVLIGSDPDGARVYTEGPSGWIAVDPDTRIATLLSDGRLLYANAWEGYELLRSNDLGETWTPLQQDFGAFSQSFVGPSGVAGTNTITSSAPWATFDADERPTISDQPIDRTRAETYLSWSTDGQTWHHETTTSAFGYPAFAYLAIGDGVVLAVATPLFGEPYVEGSVPTELYRAVLP